MKFIAHARKEDREEQLLKDHLLETRDIAKNCGAKLQLGKVAGLAGLLHDFGKFSIDFQNYLRKAIADPASVTRGEVDHSTAGGKLLFDLLHNKENTKTEKLLAEIVGNAIISHHSSAGLLDFLSPDLESDYLKRVVEKDIAHYEEMKVDFFREALSERELNNYVQEAVAELSQFIRANKFTPKQVFFVTKFIYSCLIDADRTNTMLFEQNKDSVVQIDRQQLFANYHERLVQHITALNKNAVKNPINKLRDQMSKECENFADRQTGIYTLSIPTGGGKTLASLRFALKHAQLHEKERIIYVVPYTTIIEQNADTVRKVLKEDRHILEHHSNVIEEDLEKIQKMLKEDNNQNPERFNNLQKMDESEYSFFEENQLHLTKDNWDSPIIFTTMVQFLEVIYGRGTRGIRRFHNLMNAVVIFDEAQCVPIKCLSMFNEALNFMKVRGRTTSVLCTATQPALDAVENPLNFDDNGEMVPDLDEVIEAFKRVDIISKVETQPWSIARLIDFTESLLPEKKSILVILNTKSTVRKAYQEMLERKPEGVSLFHLSTSMCPAHRKDILKTIKGKLGKEPLVVFSSQLIEAGVDISLECVIRSVAGLDSIAQAAGRCNRNGEAKRQEVFMINLDSEAERLGMLQEIDKGQQTTKIILRDMELDPTLHHGDVLTVSAINQYFREFFTKFKGQQTYPVNDRNRKLELFPLMSDAGRAAYKGKVGREVPLCLTSSSKTIGKYFQVIDSPTVSVVVPYNKEGNELIADLNGDLPLEDLQHSLKRAQQYSVNLFDYELKKLVDEECLLPLQHFKMFALSDRAYSEDYGVDISGEGNFSDLLI